MKSMWRHFCDGDEEVACARAMFDDAKFRKADLHTSLSGDNFPLSAFHGIKWCRLILKYILLHFTCGIGFLIYDLHKSKEQLAVA